MSGIFFGCKNLGYIYLKNLNTFNLYYWDLLFGDLDNVVICINEYNTTNILFSQIIEKKCQIIECSDNLESKQKQIINDSDCLCKDNCDNNTKYKYDYNRKFYKNYNNNGIINKYELQKFLLCPSDTLSKNLCIKCSYNYDLLSNIIIVITICILIIISFLIKYFKSKNNNSYIKLNYDDMNNTNIINQKLIIDEKNKNQKIIMIIKYYIYNKYKDNDFQDLTLENLINEIYKKYKEKINNNKLFTNLNKNISDLYNNLNDFNSKINSEISLKPNIDDINNLLKNTSNINIVNEIQKQIDNINIKLKEFEYNNNQIYSHILSIENNNKNNPNYNYKIIDNNEELNLLKNDLNELKNSLIMKVDINEIKNYLNQKANIVQVNKAISMINKEIDNKLDNEIFLSNIKKQEEINKILCNENITGKWLSINQNFNLSSIKWNLQSINTNPNNFGWVKNLNYITIRDKGVYSIEFIIFILGYNQMIKPNVNLLIDGNPILNFTNLEKNEMDNNLIALKYNEYINIEDSCRIGIGLTSNGINENRGIKAILIIKSI
jgi:hypothetical protein